MARSPSQSLPVRRRGPLVLLAAALAGAALAGGALLLAERLRGPATAPSLAATPAPLEVAPAATPADPAAPARWRCPMHPGVVRALPGRCPICGMTLVRDADGADHR